MLFTPAYQSRRSESLQATKPVHRANLPWLAPTPLSRSECVRPPRRFVVARLAISTCKFVLALLNTVALMIARPTRIGIRYLSRSYTFATISRATIAFVIGKVC